MAGPSYHDPIRLRMELQTLNGKSSSPRALLLTGLVLAGISPLPAADKALGTDRVEMLFPSAPGPNLRLGDADPNTVSGFVIEAGIPATPAQEGNLRYWNLPSHTLTYASGGAGWTSRLHLHASLGSQQFTWKTQHGFLSSPADVKNQEFTAFIRVHRILDPTRAAITLKIRGGRHTASAPDLASGIMLTFAPARKGSVTRFGKELVHPYYDYVDLPPAFPAALEENTWYGLKLVSWNGPGQVVNRLYLDTAPFEAGSGRPLNNWRLFSEYVDADGKSTGRYSKLVDWGGFETTLRTDGFLSIDFALVSVREITPPR